MAGADARAEVAVEVFVEEDVVAKVRVGLELLGSAEDGSPAVFVQEEGPDHPARQLDRGVAEAHLLARAGGKLHPELLAVEVVELLERLDDEVVDGEPD